MTKDDATITYLCWLRDPEVTKYTGIKMMSMKELKHYIQSKEHLFGIFLKDTDEHIGNVKLEELPPDYLLAPHFNGAILLGMFIGSKQYWNQGIGKESIYLALEIAFNELQLNEVQLGVQIKNIRALKLYSKMGFHTFHMTETHYLMKIIKKTWEVFKHGNMCNWG